MPVFQVLEASFNGAESASVSIFAAGAGNKSMSFYYVSEDFPWYWRLFEFISKFFQNFLKFPAKAPLQVP
jgi:hypothetical protein